MQKGQAQYDLFCMVCHGKTGNGNGVVATYGVPAANLHLESFQQQPDGQIYHTIAWGKGQMYGYYDKLDPEERWAVVLYVRALQRAYNATREDMPPEKLAELGIQ
jgi:mono/diheme cytochrome c family protein